MSAKDFFDNTVRSALEKDGWTITHEPLFLQPSANQLAELGVPKTDIVLGFRAPYVRQFTEFAVR